MNVLFQFLRKNRYEIVLTIFIVLSAYLALTYYLGAGRDDAFITLWAGENLAQGNFFVNHNFERVEISSSLLHTLIVAGLALIAPEHVYSINKLAGLLAGLLALYLICRYRETLLPCSRHRFAAYCMIQATLAATPSVLYWNLGGLETPFVTLLLIFIGIGYLRFWRHSTPGIAAGLVIAQILFISSRPESFFIFLFTIIFILFYLRYKGWRSALPWLVILPGAFFLALGLTRVVVFGTFMPNPVYAKTSFGIWNFDAGLTYLSEFYLSSYLMLALGCITILVFVYYAVLFFRSVRRSGLLEKGEEGPLIFVLGLVVTLHLIAFFSGGDWMEYFRFMHSVVPLTAVLSFAFAAKAIDFSVRSFKKTGHSRMLRGISAVLGIILFSALWAQNLYQNDEVTSWQGDQLIRLKSSARKCAIQDLLCGKPWEHFEKPMSLDERVKMLNSCYARDREQLFPFLEKRFLQLYDVNEELVIATPQMGLFPYYLKKKYPLLNLRFIDTRGLCDQSIALLDLPGGPYGLDFGAPLARIMSGGAGALSLYLISKKPNMLYRVMEKPGDIQTLNGLGFETVLFKPLAIVFFNKDIRKNR